MSRKIVVVGVDGSDASLAALREAASYARLLDADLRCVTTWNHVAYEDIAGVFDPEKTAKEIAGESAHEVFGPVIPTWVTLVTQVGPAGQTLIDESLSAALLVVGTRGHGAIGGLLLGSVSTHCAEQAKCPVLIVPGGDTPDRTLIDTVAARAAGN
jgi:nucleotide-binding universal stress UspA family protein